MSRSKVDRVRDVFTSRLKEATEGVRLELHNQGKHAEAAVVASIAEQLRVRLGAMGIYERLELSDIIKGHKRAWPET